MWTSGIPALTIALVAVIMCISKQKNINLLIPSSHNHVSVFSGARLDNIVARLTGVFLSNRRSLTRIQNATYSGRTCLTYICLLLIVNSSDCHPNPGPITPKYPCLICNKAVKSKDPSICCDGCDN
jgi:hypothetical protein